MSCHQPHDSDADAVIEHAIRCKNEHAKTFTCEDSYQKTKFFWLTERTAKRKHSFFHFTVTQAGARFLARGRSESGICKFPAIAFYNWVGLGLQWFLWFSWIYINSLGLDEHEVSISIVEDAGVWIFTIDLFFEGTVWRSERSTRNFDKMTRS